MFLRLKRVIGTFLFAQLCFQWASAPGFCSGCVGVLTGCAEGKQELCRSLCPAFFYVCRDHLLWLRVCHFSSQGRQLLDISRAEIGEGACIQFVHSSGALTLTFSHTAQHLLESDIQLFRKYFWDRPLLYQVPQIFFIISSCRLFRLDLFSLSSLLI